MFRLWIVSRSMSLRMHERRVNHCVVYPLYRSHVQYGSVSMGGACTAGSSKSKCKTLTVSEHSCRLAFLLSLFQTDGLRNIATTLSRAIFGARQR